MPYKDKNKAKSYNRTYNRDYMPKWRAKNPDKASAIAKRYDLGPKRQIAERRRINKYKIPVFEHYGNQCVRCGFTNTLALTIDHISGGGTKHRKQVGIGRNFYKWIVDNGFPENLQTLCMNCQFIKMRTNGECRK